MKILTKDPCKDAIDTIINYFNCDPYIAYTLYTKLYMLAPEVKSLTNEKVNEMFGINHTNVKLHPVVRLIFDDSADGLMTFDVPSKTIVEMVEKEHGII